MSESPLKGIHELAEELTKRLHAGESFDNPKLGDIADRIFGGTRAAGTYTCRDAYDAMEAAAHKYLLETNATELMKAGVESFAALELFTERLATQSDRNFEQTEWQQFSTPPALALLTAKLLDLQHDDLVLEPSAGTGSLAMWPRSVGARVICNEINERRRYLLREVLGWESHNCDAEILDDVLPQEIRPTAILMNPPFTATGGRVVEHHARYGLLHIESALHRLSEGGRLVAIAGESVGLDRSTLTGWWQKIASIYSVRANFSLDGKTYRKYGAGWGLQIIVIDKIGPTPGGNWQAQLSHIVWGNSDTVQGAWKALAAVPPRIAAEAAPDAVSQDSAKNENLFVAYKPTKLTGGVDHPSVIVESASMASVTPPDISYRPRLPLEVITEGKLSNIQLERVIYAGQRHEQRLPDGARGGFYVGDGTGTGKGRVLAAIILDNWLCCALHNAEYF